MGEANPQPNDETDDVFVDELKPGTELMHGQYTIDSFLNAGGFGITYNARDSLGRRVVIKECFPGAFCRRSRYLVNARSRAHQNELESIVRLFVQEAKSLAKLDHPNIVGVHNVFEENNTAYMALDFIEGRDLLDIIEDEEATLTPEEVDGILRAILTAVQFTHDLGILHRDISPDNILVDSNMHPTLIDFGAAREQATKQSRVLSALRVVKDGYSPQEFYIQGSEQGPFSDLYALGASFYHVLAGEVPPNSQARLAAIASGQPDPYEPLEGTIPELSQPFLAALDKSLAVLPKDRVQTAADWIAMMDGAMKVVPAAPSVLATASAAGTAAPKVEQEKKSKLGLLLATTGVVALMAGAFVFTQTGGSGEGETSVAAVDGGVTAAVAVEPTDTAVAAETPVVETVVEAPATDVAVVETPVVPVPAETTQTVDIFEAAAALAAAQEATETEALAADPVIEAEPEATLIAPVTQDDAALALPEQSAVEPQPETEVAAADVVAAEVADVEVAAVEVSAVDTASDEAIEDVATAAEITDVPFPFEIVDVSSTRIVSGDPTEIFAPTGAPLGVSVGPFADFVSPVATPAPVINSAFLTLAGDIRRPTLRPVDLDTTGPTLDLALGSPSSVGSLIADAQTTGATAGFPEILPEPLQTPFMPIERAELVSFNGVMASLDARSMATVPDVPTIGATPVALPSIDLPVFPFADEILPEPEVSASVTTASVPVLPYEGLFDAATNETRIFSVNGQAVETQEQFNAVVARDADLDALSEITVLLGTGLSGSDDISEQELTLPVAQNIALLNGATFQSTLNEGAWETRVTAMPDDISSDLELGDTVLALVGTTVLLTERTALAELLEREIAAGTEDFSFAVSRNGSTWVASISYDDSQYAAEN